MLTYHAAQYVFNTELDEYKVQDELDLDETESLDHWAKLLADQECSDRDSGEWDYHYERISDMLECNYTYELLRP
jgi:hypothetical protein